MADPIITPTVAAAGVTGILGLTQGLVGARSRRRQTEAQLQAQKQQQVSQLELQRGAQQQQSLNNIIVSLRSAFLG